MASLTKEQLDFLDRHAIPECHVMDISGMPATTARLVMKEHGKRFSYGGAPCRKGGHTLKTRRGHCIQCRPSSIAFMNRYEDEGFIYIAGSRSQRLLKIGTSRDHDQRLKMLNGCGYAGATDWAMLYLLRTKEAGRIEQLAHTKLRAYQAVRSYWRDGKMIACRETFRCPFSIAQYVLSDIAGPQPHVWMLPGSAADYDFAAEELRRTADESLAEARGRVRGDGEAFGRRNREGGVGGQGSDNNRTEETYAGRQKLWEMTKNSSPVSAKISRGKSTSGEINVAVKPRREDKDDSRYVNYAICFMGGLWFLSFCITGFFI